MPRARRDVPWIDVRDNGVYYAHWYDADARQTRRHSLDTRDPGEAAKRFGQFLVDGVPRARGEGDAGVTVRAALADYLAEHVEQTDDRGRPLVADQERQRTVILHLTAWFGDTPLASVGPAESRAYVDARRSGIVGGGRGKRARKTKAGSDNTIRRELNCLVAAFNHAVKWGRLPADSRSRIELPAETRGDSVKWLTKDQLADVLSMATGKLHDFILVAYHTGARRRSIENLTRFQVDLANGRINLMPPDARSTKKRKPVVPIYPEIRPTIERLVDEARDGLLFGQDFYRPFVQLLERMGIEGHPHMLRHSRATHLLMDGESIYKVARLLGDTVATVERVYGHSDPEFLMPKKEAAS